MGLQVRSTVAPVGEAGRSAAAVMLASITTSPAGASSRGAPPTEGNTGLKDQKHEHRTSRAVWSSYIV